MLKKLSTPTLLYFLFSKTANPIFYIFRNCPKLSETRKTPIMIGGSVLAYTLLGIAVDEDQPQNSQFLILDPHYKGKEDIKTILNPKSKAVYWSKSNLFKPNAFYNFCCPLPK